jgi:hypothetical protein
MLIFPLLQAIVLVRFVDVVFWDAPQTWFYLGFLFIILLVGIAGTWRARQVAASAA